MFMEEKVLFTSEMTNSSNGKLNKIVIAKGFGSYKEEPALNGVVYRLELSESRANNKFIVKTTMVSSNLNSLIELHTSIMTDLLK